MALPFKEGWAPVKQGNYFKYISETYDRNPSRSILVVDFHYGDMTSASCFSNGHAAIAYNRDFALIGMNGKKIRKLNGNEFIQTYKNNNFAPKTTDSFSDTKVFTVFSENNLYGLKSGNDVIASPQFGSFDTHFSDGYVIAVKNNRHGLLTTVDGDYRIDMTSQSGSPSDLNVDYNGNTENVNLNISLPIAPNHLNLKIDNGDGQMRDMTSQLSLSGNKATISIPPIPPPTPRTVK